MSLRLLASHTSLFLTGCKKITTRPHIYAAHTFSQALTDMLVTFLAASVLPAYCVVSACLCILVDTLSYTYSPASALHYFFWLPLVTCCNYNYALEIGLRTNIDTTLLQKKGKRNHCGMSTHRCISTGTATSLQKLFCIQYVLQIVGASSVCKSVRYPSQCGHHRCWCCR
jgi:hypothetical protein